MTINELETLHMTLSNKALEMLEELLTSFFIRHKQALSKEQRTNYQGHYLPEQSVEIAQ